MRKRDGKTWVIILFVVMIIVIAGAFLKKMDLRKNMLFSDVSGETTEILTESESFSDISSDHEATLRSRKYIVTDAFIKTDADDGAAYIGIDLTIENPSDAMITETLNNNALYIIDPQTEEKQILTLDYMNEIGGKTDTTYFHFDVDANSSNSVQLFFKMADPFPDEYEILLHINPYGTEGAYAIGKTEDGKTVILNDSNNTADIDITALLIGGGNEADI